MLAGLPPADGAVLQQQSHGSVARVNGRFKFVATAIQPTIRTAVRAALAAAPRSGDAGQRRELGNSDQKDAGSGFVSALFERLVGSPRSRASVPPPSRSEGQPQDEQVTADVGSDDNFAAAEAWLAETASRRKKAATGLPVSPTDAGFNRLHYDLGAASSRASSASAEPINPEARVAFFKSSSAAAQTDVSLGIGPEVDPPDTLDLSAFDMEALLTDASPFGPSAIQGLFSAFQPSQQSHHGT